MSHLSYPSKYPSLRRTRSFLCITSFPSTMGRNSLYVICWIRAAIICLVSCNKYPVQCFIISEIFLWILKVQPGGRKILIPGRSDKLVADYIINLTWKRVSSFQWGFIFESSTAILLCSLTKRRWTMANTVCSLTLEKVIGVHFVWTWINMKLMRKKYTIRI